MDVVQRIEHNGHSESPQLVDRMDSAIGEASTSIGMIMSELVRRSLRGGVGEIGSSIHDYARDQVGVAVDEMMPRVALAVEELAESTSQRVTDGAVQRFGEELKCVESRTTEQTQVFAARIKAESDAALEAVYRVVGESRETVQSTAQDLKDLHQRAKDSWKKVQLELQTINEGRAQLERRLTETREHLDQTRRQLSETREHLDDSRMQLSEIRKQLGQSQQDLTRTRQELASATDRLAELAQSSSQKIRSLDSTCAGLAGRLDELERPKGIRALFTRFTGGQKKQPGIGGEPAGTEIPENMNEDEA